MFDNNDYLFTIGDLDHFIVTAIPNKALNYDTLVKPYDGYIWALIGISLATVIASFIIIENLSASWTNRFVTSSLYQST